MDEVVLKSTLNLIELNTSHIIKYIIINMFEII